jgi:pentapeptide MXKDX repeat protein
MKVVLGDRPATCFFNPAGNNRDPGIVPTTGACAASENRFQKGRSSMTVSTRIVLGISADALWLTLAIAPAAFAQDPMSQDIDFRNGLSRDVGVRKDTMARATMSKDPEKKDDRIKKYGVPK